MTSKHLKHWLTLLKTGRSLPHTDKLPLIHDTYVWLESTQQQKLFPRLQGISADPQAIGDDISRKTCQAWIQLGHQLKPQYRLQLGWLIQAFWVLSASVSWKRRWIASEEFFPAAARGVSGNSRDFPRNPTLLAASLRSFLDKSGKRKIELIYLIYLIKLRTYLGRSKETLFAGYRNPGTQVCFLGNEANKREISVKKKHGNMKTWITKTI